MSTARDALRHLLTDRLGDRFRIIDELGLGGMAVVYLAENIDFGRLVALKVLRPDKILDNDIAARFRSEALAIAKLRHPNIIGIHSKSEDKDEDLLWFEMDYVEGGSLDGEFSKGVMDWPRMMRLVAQAAGALEHAHLQGVIHRDIKPSNLLLSKPGDHLTITDFGIAKILGRTTLTETGVTLGTFAYMSPEQLMADKELTGATDQYSLGVVAFEGITGRQPFLGESTGQTTLAKLNGPPASIAKLIPECPPDLDLLITRMLAPDPAMRWPDLRAVQRFAEEISVSGRSPSLHKTRRTSRRSRTRRTAAVLSAAVLIAAVVGGALLIDASPNAPSGDTSLDGTKRNNVALTPTPPPASIVTGNVAPGDTSSKIPVQNPVPVNSAVDGANRTSPNRPRPRQEDVPDGPSSQPVGTSIDTGGVPEQVAPTTGTLRIASSLPGTFLYLNGSSTPYLLTADFQEFTVPAGSVRMVLRSNQPGCTEREDAVTITGGEVRSLRRTAACPEG